MTNTVKRGDIFYADMSWSIGSEQGGVRPVLIVQNDIGNKHSPTTIVVSITSKIGKTNIPTHVKIHKNSNNGLKKDSIITCEQIKTIDKERLLNKIGRIDTKTLMEVLVALKISLMMQ